MHTKPRPAGGLRSGGVISAMVEDPLLDLPEPPAAPWKGREDSIEEIRLCADGRWLHQGQEISHPRIVRAFHQGIEPWLGDDSFDYIIHMGDFRYPIVVEDTAYSVEGLKILETERIELLLNTGGTVSLDPSTLYVGDNDVLYCLIFGKEHSARFRRGAYAKLWERIEELVGGGYALRLGNEQWPIGEG